MAADGSIIIDTRIDTGGFAKGAGNLKTQFAGLGSSVKKLGGLVAHAVNRYNRKMNTARGGA